MSQSQASLANPVPPAAQQRPVTRALHGVTLTDEFAWLRAANWQEVLRDPKALPDDIRALLEAENAYAQAMLGPALALQTTLLAEMRGRILEADQDPPSPDGGFAYYQRYNHGGQHELLCRRPRDGGDETILVNGDDLAQGLAYFHLGHAMHSPDHGTLAWSFDDKGSELFTLRLRNIATGIDLHDTLTGTDGSAVWSADGKSLYYVRIDDNHRPSRVLRHRIGTEMAADVLVFEEPDPGFFVNVRALQTGHYAAIAIHDHDSSECRLIDLRNTQAPLRLVEPRQPGIRYDVQHRGAHLYLLTNAGAAKDFKLVRAPVEAPARPNWVDEVPHLAGRMIVAQIVVQDYSARLERENGLPRIVVTQAASGEQHSIAFDEEAYSLSMEPGYEFATTTLRFTYSSMTTPREIYDYDMATRQRVLVKRQHIPSGHDPSNYVTRRIFARAADGEMVPVSILYRSDRDLRKPSPLLLYAYGAYGHAIPAAFSANRLSLVDRGFVYAIAHVRGGTDKGWDWYENGKLAKKPNTFSDFIAVARHMIAQGFTAQGHIVAHGGSAGGMLMGAIANLAPELFAGIIADVPFVDVLTTMLDDTLPLTPPEWLEWGNPITDATAFDTIRNYSPYDNVRAQSYPAIFAQGGLSDPRVTYWEPAKWVARLRARMTGGGPILLKTNMDAGHGGASGRFSQLEEVALDYAFALTQTGTLA